MLGRFLGVMQQGYRVTGGFPQKVYGWHVDAIQQVQQEKGCNNAKAGTSSNPVVSGQLGVQFETVSPAMARTLGMRGAYGALVVDQAAGQEGLRPRDVVVEREKTFGLIDFLLPIDWHLHQEDVSRLYVFGQGINRDDLTAADGGAPILGDSLDFLFRRGTATKNCGTGPEH